MESLVEGINSLHSLGYNPPSSADTNKPPRPFFAKHPRCKGASSVTIFGHGIDAGEIPEGLVRNIRNAANEIMEKDVEDTSKHHPQSNKGNMKSVHTSDKADQTKVNCSQKCASSVRVFDSSSVLVEAADLVLVAKEVGAHENSPTPSNVRVGCPSPQKSTTQLIEAKQSFTNTEVSESANSIEKSIECGEVSYSYDFAENRKTSIRGSTGSDLSDTNQMIQDGKQFKPSDLMMGTWG